jgi:predicted SAM-dependent methyltransferase
MGIDTLGGSKLAYLDGSELREGKVFAQNRDCNVEERYPTAYNLGCGDKHWAHWINVDASLFVDADIVSDLRHLPIASDSADAVAAIHVLEHFYQWEAFDLLSEWRRILKPGGKMILELPCMDKVCGYIVKSVKNKTGMQPFMTMHAFYGNPQHKEPAMCHKWGYFQQALIDLLKKVGMREIQSQRPRYHFAFRDMRIECLK